MKSLRNAAAVGFVAGVFLFAGNAVANYSIRDGNNTLQQVFSYLCQSTVICPAHVLIDSSGAEKATASNPLQQKFGSYFSAGSGTSQFGLTISSGTTLTVPSGASCAQITLESANIRRTSDGTAPTSTVGTLIPVGSQWQDCGPLASYKFSAVSGSPSLNVEYFK